MGTGRARAGRPNNRSFRLKHAWPLPRCGAGIYGAAMPRSAGAHPQPRPTPFGTKVYFVPVDLYQAVLPSEMEITYANI